MGGQRSLQDLHSRKGIQRPFLHNGNSQRRVSEAGHSRRFRHLHLMSAFFSHNSGSVPRSNK